MEGRANVVVRLNGVVNITVVRLGVVKPAVVRPLQIPRNTEGKL